MKIGLVSSGGGHLYQLWQIRKSWQDFDTFWVSFDNEDVNYVLKDNSLYYAYYPESRNVVNFIRNFFLAIKILRREKPKVIISGGAGLAFSFFLAAKFFKITTVYIEPVDFIKKPSLTGRLVYRLVDVFLVQNKMQLKTFPKAKYWGSSI